LALESEQILVAVGGKSKRTILKACLFLVFVCGAVILGNFGPLRESLTAERLGRFLILTGVWGPILFVLLYGVGICLFIPGIVLTSLGAAIFGAYWGFLFTWAGAMLGASGAFFISRVLAREFVSSRIGDRLRQYDDAIGRNGFTTVLYLRLLCSPFTPTCFGLGVTKVRFRDYLFGTGLGIAIATFAVTFLVGNLKVLWASGDWRGLFSIKVAGALSILFLSLFIPMILRRINRKPESRAPAGRSTKSEIIPNPECSNLATLEDHLVCR
jgi:uncharacterized membrane protein YdjX (TVP38/TMEM64 family)